MYYTKMQTNITLFIETMRTAIKETIEYTGTHTAFGKPILTNQVVHFRLAELVTEVEALKSLIYRTVGQTHFSCQEYK